MERIEEMVGPIPDPNWQSKMDNGIDYMVKHAYIRQVRPCLSTQDACLLASLSQFTRRGCAYTYSGRMCLPSR